MQETKKTKLRNTLLITTFLFAIIATGCELTRSPDEILTENEMLLQEKGRGPDIPINNPSSFIYAGQSSGLYTWGNQLIANSYKTDYINANQEIKTLNSLGVSSVNGKIGILQIGGSNPGILFNGIEHARLNDAGFGSKLTFVNAGLNSMDLSNMLSPAAQYWSTVQTLLSQKGINSSQVQVLFCVQDNLTNSDTKFSRAVSLKYDYITLLNTVRTKFPNCKVFLIGDRGYTGYSTDPRHKEPIGYLNGWGVKLFVQEYSNGVMPEYPFVNWLDYYWANGTTDRFDGLDYEHTDFNGGIHFTEAKANELGLATHNRLKMDIGTLNWYK